MRKAEKPRRKNKKFPYAVFCRHIRKKFLKYFLHIHSKIKNRKIQSIPFLKQIDNKIF